MSTHETIAVRLRGLPNGESRGTVRVERWERSERLRRAVTALTLIWVSSGALLFVPGVHIAAIPLFLFVGPLAFFMRYRTVSVVTGGGGECPECSAQLSIMSAQEEWPLFDICKSCSKHVKIERV